MCSTQCSWANVCSESIDKVTCGNGKGIAGYQNFSAEERKVGPMFKTESEAWSAYDNTEVYPVCEIIFQENHPDELFLLNSPN